MFSTGNSKRYACLGVIFCLFAILFAILYFTDSIKYLNLTLAVTYVSYFIGLALMYNGAYNREKNHTTSTRLNFIFGFVFILLSISLLIYGLITGLIVIF